MSEPANQIHLDSLNLHDAERRLCEAALARTDYLTAAAALLGITRHALRRRMIKLKLVGPGAHDTLT